MVFCKGIEANIDSLMQMCAWTTSKFH